MSLIYWSLLRGWSVNNSQVSYYSFLTGEKQAQWFTVVPSLLVSKSSSSPSKVSFWDEKPWVTSRKSMCYCIGFTDALSAGHVFSVAPRNAAGSFADLVSLMTNDSRVLRVWPESGVWSSGWRTKAPCFCASCPVVSATSCSVARQAPLSMGLLQAGIMEWVAMPPSKGSSQPRDWTQVSRLAGRFFTIWAPREAQGPYYPTVTLT